MPFLTRQLEYARNKAASTRSSRRFPDQEESLSSAPPSTLFEQRSSAPPAAGAPGATTERAYHCGGAAASSASTLPAERGETGGAAAWNGSRCHTATSSSNADEQTDGAESSEGEGGRGALASGHCPPEKSSGVVINIRRTRGVPSTSGAADGTPEESAAARASPGSEPVAWELHAAALNALEVVGQRGAEVVRRARDAARQVGGWMPNERFCLATLFSCKGKKPRNHDGSVSTFRVGRNQSCAWT